MAAELRVGILCEGLTFQRWQADCIRQVLAVPGVKLAGLVMDEGAPRSAHGLSTRLYRAYRHRWFKPAAMDTVDLSVELAQAPRIACTAPAQGSARVFSTTELQRIRELRPDVLLRFAFGIVRGEVLTLPTHGVWSYHHGDEQKFRGGPPGFWEIMKGDPVTGAILQRLTDKLDAGLVLRKGWFSTIDHSLEETVDTVLTHSAPWAADVCRALLSGDADAATGTASGSTAPVYKYPDNLTFLRFLRKQARNKVRFHRAQLKEHEEWNVGVLYQPIHHLLEERPSLNVQWLPAPAKSAFRADPFGYVGSDGQLNMLYERYDRATGKGDINRLRPKRDNVLKRSRAMLTLPSHLSYPYVVNTRDANGEQVTYVIPENAAGGGVDLYRVRADNEALEPVQRLLDVPLYDPTVFEHEGRWWMMGTLAPLTNVHLVIYHAPSLFGPWTPHARNPVKCDIRTARPAGTPFVHGGMLYRPSQDSSSTYGHRVVINRVEELTPERFREVALKTVGPLGGTSWNKGFHTVSAVGDLTLVDGKRYVHSPEQEARVRGAKLARLWNKRSRR
ncbi:MAG: hypothetical protein JNL05_04455 [Flavobacteriales bacterium]|nr:hypothetical protein [Flavobacteriales bacterium]